MKKGLAHFFLTLALVLLFGHTLLPHNHAEPVVAKCEIRNKSEISIFEVLKFSLTHNLGANHLEDYNKFRSDTISFSDDEYPAYIPAIVEPKLVRLEPELAFMPEMPDSSRGLFYTTFTLRGPPLNA
jgi:hypothetical protein